MKKYQYATKVQRGLCFTIDVLVVLVFAIAIAHLSIYCSSFNVYYQNACELGYAQIFKNPTSSEAIGCIVAILYRIGILALAFLVVMIIYLIILPYFTSFQTFGRWITKTKLVSRKSEHLTIKQLIMREIVGEYLIYVLLSIILRFMNMVFYISVGYCFLQDISIPDLISKTKIVTLKQKNPGFEFKAEEFEYSEDYDWENDTLQEVNKEDENAVSEK